jgi:hypothetical protein
MLDAALGSAEPDVQAAAALRQLENSYQNLPLAAPPILVTNSSTGCTISPGRKCWRIRLPVEPMFGGLS